MEEENQNIVTETEVNITILNKIMEELNNISMYDKETRLDKSKIILNLSESYRILKGGKNNESCN